MLIRAGDGNTRRWRRCCSRWPARQMSAVSAAADRDPCPVGCACLSAWWEKDMVGGRQGGHSQRSLRRLPGRYGRAPEFRSYPFPLQGGVVMKIWKFSSISIVAFALFAVIALYAPSSIAVDEGGNSACATETNACGKCGDGYCNKRCGETTLSCPKDCGGSAGSAQEGQAQAVPMQRAPIQEAPIKEGPIQEASIQLACARCGDGVCARSCENERSCPKDCAAKATSIFAFNDN